MNRPATNELSAAKLALEIKRLRETRPEAQLAFSEPIAIVGLGCRFPGGVSSPADYWRLLSNGIDAVTEVPAERWDASALYAADPQAAGKMNTRWGGFLAGIDGFDPVFFGVAPREAASMDPQQRLLLEVTWEALWEGGFAPDRLAGTSTGVFTAIYKTDYARLMLADAQAIGPHTCAGAAHSIASGRISYLLDLHGPSVSVDTACSSSLVAVALACQSLRLGECRMALAGGVSLTLTAEHYLCLSKLAMLSPEGRSKTFDAAADGFVPGEGCGMVVLKRLADALADGDRIHAVIRGAAVNQDGRTNVLTAPNGLAQQSVLRAALANAQVDPGRISYIETHGTGTALGDPIELEALAEVLGATAPGVPDCFLGAVKTNFGHLEAAAGIAGLIKAVLALEQQKIPANLHFHTLNPHISLEGTRLRIPTEITPWPAGSEPRFAGVSSFGFGGTNAHIVLEEAPRVPAPRSPDASQGGYLLPISARTPAALEEFACRWRMFLGGEGKDTPIYDVCRSAALRRSHYEERLAVTGASASDLCRLLDHFLEGRTQNGFTRGRASRDNGGVVFVCSGQGSQWARMGVGLLKQPTFRGVIEKCEELIGRYAGWSLLAELAAPEGTSRLAHTEYAQPAIFAVEVALAELWQSWGILPAAIIGHSAGEVAAAHIAGALTLEEATRVVVDRGRLMERATGLGCMAVVRLPAATVARTIAPYGSSVSIAAINSPVSTVVSGEQIAIEELLGGWRQDGTSCRRMQVDYAFHSTQMQPFQEELTRILAPVATRPTKIPILSTVLGQEAAGEALDAAYWGHNVRRPVLFATAVGIASSRNLRTFVEIGPNPVLLNSIGECLEAIGETGTLVSSLRRNQDEVTSLLHSLGALYSAGLPIAWPAVYPRAAAPVTLPVYPYQRQRFWIGHRRTPEHRNGSHPLLGARLRSPSLRGYVWQTIISLSELPYLADHRIENSVLLPMTAFVEMVDAAARESFCRSRALVDLIVTEPLRLSEDSPVTVQIVIEEEAFRVFSLAGEEWYLHARGRFAEIRESEPIERPREPVQSAAAHYEHLAKQGIQLGAAFQTLTNVAAADGEAVGRVRLAGSEQAGASEYRFHPALLDGCLQATITAAGEPLDGLYLPFAIERLEILGAGEGEAWVRARLHSARSTDRVSADLVIHNADGTVLARVDGLHLKRRTPAQATPNYLYQIEWRESKRGAPTASATGIWAIIADVFDDGLALAAALRRRGLAIEVLSPGGRLPKKLNGVVRLLERMRTETTEPAAAEAQSTRSVLMLTQDLIRNYPADPPQLWIVTRDAVAPHGDEICSGLAQAPVWGLARTIAIEHPELRTVRVDLDPADSDYAALAEEILQTDGEEEIALRGGERYVPRLVPGRIPSLQPRQWRVDSRGSLDKLALGNCNRRAPEADEVEIAIAASALNFRDVLNVLGMYPGDPGPLGLEFCGRVTRVGAGVERYQPGDRVMGLGWGSLADFVTTPAAFLVPVPEKLDSVAAATVPNAFLTAHHCLIHLGCLQPGERVLIHAATGGVGIAAVALARRAGAEIFATAGSEEKRAWLRSLGVQHVFSSRTLDFAQEILSQTGGRGVDLVLNSLAGDFIAAGMRALSVGGRFIEIGKIDTWPNERVAALGKSIRYFVVDLATVLQSDPALVQDHLEKIHNALACCELNPLPACVFDFENAPAAFRYMAQAKHIGKIVLRHAAGMDPVGNRTYLVTGGLGAIGLRMAERLVERGARNLVLVSRRSPEEKAIAAIEALRRTGARVEVRAADVSRRAEIARVIEEITEKMPPLGGIVHAAGVLDDGVLTEQTWDRLERVMAPKIAGSWNLHELTAGQPLDFFVLCSSIAAVTGSPGQAGYAAGNAFLDALAQYRRARGLPALSVNWGAWAEGGMAARTETDGRRRVLAGIRSMSAEKYLAQLEQAERINTSQIAITDANWSEWQPTPGLLTSLVNGHFSPAIRRGRSGDLAERLATVPPANRRQFLVNALREQTRNVLGLEDGFFIDERQPLIQMGLDSLMAVEFRNQLAIALKRPLSATLLFDQPTIGALADFLQGTPAPHVQARPDPLLMELKDVSEDEAEELLKEELERR